MTSGIGSICFACALREGDSCAAFPDGIPVEVLFGAFDHRQEYGGEEAKPDGSPILFVLDESEEGREALAAYERVKDANEG